MNFRKHWWKLLTVLLLVFVIAGGLYFPLSPGIRSYAPDHAHTGSLFSLTVQTEGTDFKAHHDGSLRAWLVFDSTRHIEASVCRFHPGDAGMHRLDLVFAVPNEVLQDKRQVKMMDLYLNDDYHGDLYLASAVTVSYGKDSVMQEAAHFKDPIRVKQEAPVYFSFPNRELLKESIRNLFFHVPMWFGMTLLLILSVIYSIRVLWKKQENDDLLAAAFARVALLLGILGIITGAMWARVTWGAWWNNDPKQDAAAVGLLMYLAYFVLRGSMDDLDKKARVSAVANVFFFFIFIPMIFVVPRLTSSLHPGNGGNPGFNTYDLDNHLRIFFYAAVIGWTLLGVWLARLQYTLSKLVRNQRIREAG